MNITCPNCALHFPLIAGMNDSQARRVARLMGELPPELSSPMLEYLSLFKPPKSGLTWTRTCKLLGEIAPWIKDGQITRKGRTWAAPKAHWQVALQSMMERRHTFTLPLKSHGYLLEILTGLADKAEAEAECQREQQRQQRPGTHETAGRSIADIRSELRHFEGLLPACPKTARAGMEKQVAHLKTELKARQGQHGGA